MKTSPSRPRIGLVLGAGGVSGAAFHAGTLLALEQDVGWDPRNADVIVGSSAGAIVGALLRSGLSTDDLAAWAAAVPASGANISARALLDEVERSPFTVRRPRLAFGSWSVKRLLSALSRGGIPAHTAILSMMPDGWFDMSTGLSRFGGLVDAWPHTPLWIPAVRTSDGKRIVFGRDATDVPLGQAIAATSAIPLLFRPVTIGDHQFIDGATHSPTNADVLSDAEIDVALVLSPMSGVRADLSLLRPDHVLRARWHRRLETECRALRSAGIDVHVIEPGSATIKAMGINVLQRSRTRAVVREAFLQTGPHANELRRHLGAPRLSTHGFG